MSGDMAPSEHEHLLRDPPLVVSCLSFAYGRERVLDDVSFSVRAGAFLGIIGPNGCGKTTLLRLMLRLLPSSPGTIFLEGKDIHTYPRRQIARICSYVPQFFDRDFAFTARQMVMMGRHPYIGRLERESDEDRAKVREAMEVAEIWRIRHKFVSRMSGGEAQRVSLARALVQEPRILFVDEPTSHLDIHHQLQVLSLLRKINRERGVTVIAVLHDLNHTFSFCDHVLMLADGTVEAYGGPEEVITPASLRKVYGIEAVVERNPFSGKPHLIPNLEYGQ